MANCARCNTKVDCGCVFKDGKHCDTCYYFLLAEGKIFEKKENTCGQTIEHLEYKQRKVNELYPDKKGKRVWFNAILNSQIKKLDTDPCKYFDIIQKI